MITLRTHRRHKSPFQHSKTIDVFTSGPGIVNVQIHSIEKGFEGVKMTTANRTSIQERRTIYAIVLQDLMKRALCKRAVEMLLYDIMSWFP